MSTTLGEVTAKKRPTPSAEEAAALELVRMAKEKGLSLTGPHGLLKEITKSVLETALNEEMTEHLGHEKHRAPEARDSSNVRNGSRPKTVLTSTTGPVQIEVPRDRDGTFESVIVKKRQRRLTDVDEVVLSLSARVEAPTPSSPSPANRSLKARSTGSRAMSPVRSRKVHPPCHGGVRHPRRLGEDRGRALRRVRHPPREHCGLPARERRHRSQAPRELAIPGLSQA